MVNWKSCCWVQKRWVRVEIVKLKWQTLSVPHLWFWGAVPRCLLLSSLGASIAFPAAIHMPSSGAQWGPPRPGALCHWAELCQSVWWNTDLGWQELQFLLFWKKLGKAPQTTTAESVQIKDLVSLSVPSVVFSGSSVISCHFRIWAYWTSGSMDWNLNKQWFFYKYLAHTV